jgi:hypothetical protein
MDTSAPKINVCEVSNDKFLFKIVLKMINNEVESLVISAIYLEEISSHKSDDSKKILSKVWEVILTTDQKNSNQEIIGEYMITLINLYSIFDDISKKYSTTAELKLPSEDNDQGELEINIIGYKSFLKSCLNDDPCYNIKLECINLTAKSLKQDQCKGLSTPSVKKSENCVYIKHPEILYRNAISNQRTVLVLDPLTPNTPDVILEKQPDEQNEITLTEMRKLFEEHFVPENKITIDKLQQENTELKANIRSLNSINKDLNLELMKKLDQLDHSEKYIETLHQSDKFSRSKILEARDKFEDYEQIIEKQKSQIDALLALGIQNSQLKEKLTEKDSFISRFLGRDIRTIENSNSEKDSDTDDNLSLHQQYEKKRMDELILTLINTSRNLDMLKKNMI